MSTYDERRVTAIVERSAVVLWLARLGAAGGRALQHSSLLALARPLASAVRLRPGLSLIAAAVTHLAVMTAVSRPPSWYWLILPSAFAVIGVMLWLMVDERSGA